MPTQTVNTHDLHSGHLGKFAVITARHLKSPTVCIGRLIGIEHNLADRVDMSQRLTIALNGDEVMQFDGNYEEVLLADDAAELILELAEKVRASRPVE